MESSTPRIPPRRPDLLSREIDGEFVVVDEASGQAHELSGDVAAVWRAAEDGSEPTLAEARAAEVVAELVALGLLQVTPGMTRRAMIQRGSAVVALTGLATIGLPAAAAFASSSGGQTITPATGGTTFTIPAGARQISIEVFGGGGAASGPTAGGLAGSVLITYAANIATNITGTYTLGLAGAGATGGTGNSNGGTAGTASGVRGGGGGGSTRLDLSGGASGTVVAAGGGGAGGAGVAGTTNGGAGGSGVSGGSPGTAATLGGAGGGGANQGTPPGQGSQNEAGTNRGSGGGGGGGSTAGGGRGTGGGNGVGGGGGGGGNSTIGSVNISGNPAMTGFTAGASGDGKIIISYITSP